MKAERIRPLQPKRWIVRTLDLDKAYLNKTAYAVIATVMLVLFTIFAYTDFAITTRNGINVWESIFQGRFFQYYTMNLHLDIADGRFGNYSAMYNIAMYLLFAIWDLPLWIIEKLCGIDTLMYWEGLLYAKCILLPILLWTIAQIKDVCGELGYTARQTSLAWIFFVTSLSFFTCVVEVGQYDLIAIGLMMRGIKYYIRKDERRFILWFGVAFLFKLFALLPFFALLIYREKRLLAVIWKTLATMVLYALTDGIFYITDFAAKAEMLGSTASLAQYLSTKPFLSSLMYFYLGIFLILLVYCFCYFFRHEGDEEEQKMYAIYVPFLVFAAFFVGCYANPYWILLMEPFVCILLVRDVRLLKVRAIAELVFSIGYTLASQIIHSWTYCLALVKYSWLGGILENWRPTRGTFGSVTSIARLLESDVGMNMEEIAGYAVSLFVVGILTFAVVSHPRSAALRLVEHEGMDYGLFYFRVVFGVLVTLLPVLCYFFI